MKRSTQGENADESGKTESVGNGSARQVSSSGSPDKSIAGDIPEDVSGPYDFTRVDYLELNDLQDLITPSASLDNSSSVPVNSNGLTQPASSGNPDKSIVGGDVPEDVSGPYDFILEDYLELNDLPSLTTSSASSDSSSRISVNSDECFDTDAFLRDIQNDILEMQDEHADGEWNIPTSVEPDQVVGMPPSGSVHRNDNLVEEGSLTSLSVTGRVSRSRSEGSLTDDAINGSHSGRTSHQGSTKSISKFAKLGRKYFCFGSF